MLAAADRSVPPRTFSPAPAPARALAPPPRLSRPGAGAAGFSHPRRLTARAPPAPATTEHMHSPSLAPPRPAPPCRARRAVRRHLPGESGREWLTETSISIRGPVAWRSAPPRSPPCRRNLRSIVIRHGVDEVQGPRLGAHQRVRALDAHRPRQCSPGDPRARAEASRRWPKRPARGDARRSSKHLSPPAGRRRAPPAAIRLSATFRDRVLARNSGRARPSGHPTGPSHCAKSSLGSSHPERYQRYHGSGAVRLRGEEPNRPNQGKSAEIRNPQNPTSPRKPGSPGVPESRSGLP